MRKRTTFIAALMLILCLALTGCAQKTSAQETGANPQTDSSEESNTLAGWRTPPPNITYDPVMVTDATPETLEDTVWVFREETNAEMGMVLFFRDGIMTVVSADACYGAPYDYRDTQMTASYGNITIWGEAIEGLLYFQTSENRNEPERIAVWTAIEEAMQFAKELNGGFTAPFTPTDLGVAINTSKSSVVTEPSEDYSVTPESLDRTAWILEYDVGQTERAALFFKDGKVTYVSWDYIYEDSYRYKNNILITDEINIGFVGTVDGAHITEVTYYGVPYPNLTRVDIPRAIQYAKELRPEFESPFDDDYPGLDFDTGDSGIMDGSNNGDGGNNGTANNSNPRYENGQYVYVVAGKEIRLSVNIWDYVKNGSKYKVLDWKGLLEHYGYDKPNSTHSQYMSTDGWKRIEVGYRYWDNHGVSGVFAVSMDESMSSGISVNIRQNSVDYSDRYIFSTGEQLPGDINCMILMAYTAEQMMNNPSSDPYAELFGEYRVSNSSTIEYVIP